MHSPPRRPIFFLLSFSPSLPSLPSLSLSYPPLLFKTFCILLATILLTFLHRIPMHIGLLAPLPLPPHQLHCLPHRPSFYPQMLLTAETLTAVTTAIVFAVWKNFMGHINRKHHDMTAAQITTLIQQKGLANASEHMSHPTPQGLGHPTTSSHRP